MRYYLTGKLVFTELEFKLIYLANMQIIWKDLTLTALLNVWRELTTGITALNKSKCGYTHRSLIYYLKYQFRAIFTNLLSKCRLLLPTV